MEPSAGQRCWRRLLRRIVKRVGRKEQGLKDLPGPTPQFILIRERKRTYHEKVVVMSNNGDVKNTGKDETGEMDQVKKKEKKK